jgi:D-alanine-D-alanine ligase
VSFASPNFPFNGVVVVADVLADPSAVPSHLRRDLEKTDHATLHELCAAMQRLGLKVYHYEHPKLLAANAKQHIGDIVLSIFGGSVSRSRMALVPAVCEATGLSFIGPDAYGRIISQDKEVSKALAAEAGLRVAPHRIVRIREDLLKLADFGTPYVAKPLWEGSSIGIGADSLITDPRRGSEVVGNMLTDFQQPIMVEAFVAGREVSYCFIEPVGHAPMRAFGEIVWEGKTDHFDHNLYDARHKEMADGRKTVRVISKELLPADEAAIEALLQLLGPIGYGRVDGKLLNGEFRFLEVTPDAWLGASGTFVTSFREQGLSFDEVIAHLLLSGRVVPQDQSTNG